MKEYCKSLEKFGKTTFIDVYLKAISTGVILSSESTKMVTIINKPASECTLHEVRKLKETIAERASLHLYSVFIGDISESSVQLELGFPSSCVGWILGVFSSHTFPVRSSPRSPTPLNSGHVSGEFGRFSCNMQLYIIVIIHWVFEL